MIRASAPHRRFTIADGMVLIAASAFGMLLARAVLPGLQSLTAAIRSTLGSGLGPFQISHWWAQELGSCLVVPLMLATIALRLRGPRPPWRRVAVQPGFAACLACAASLVPGLA